MPELGMVSAVPFILIKPQISGMSLNEYLKAQNKTNDAIRTSTFSADELHRFSKSDYRWADNRSKHFRHREVKKGEIYHPIDSPTSKSDLFLLKSSEFSFINHDSVLKLNIQNNEFKKQISILKNQLATTN